MDRVRTKPLPLGADLTQRLTTAFGATTEEQMKEDLDWWREGISEEERQWYSNRVRLAIAASLQEIAAELRGIRANSADSGTSLARMVELAEASRDEADRPRDREPLPPPRWAPELQEVRAEEPEPPAEAEVVPEAAAPERRRRGPKGETE